MTQAMQRILQPICRARSGARTGFAAAFVLLLVSPFLYGQFINGSLSGTVRDSTGAVVSGAHVTLTN